MLYKILSFNTSSNFISVALSENDKSIACNEDFANHKQAEKTVLLIEKTMIDANIWYDELDYLFVISGPGSFTSVRVGIAAAKAIVKATKIKCKAISNFEILFYRAKDHIPDCNKFFVLIDAYRNQIYCQKFIIEETDNQNYVKYPPELVNYNEVYEMLKNENDQIVCIGSGVNLIFQEIKSLNNVKYLPRLNLVRATYICKYFRYIINKPDFDKIEPLYIRMHDAKVPQVNSLITRIDASN